MPKPIVLFGGPSPEHDISVSTGLQAAHVLDRLPGGVQAVYWDKARRFHLVDASAEVRDFAEGVPRRARQLALLAEPRGGFVLKRRPLDVSVVVNCCHGGPGEDGTLQGVLDLIGYRYTGAGQRGSALGIDKLTFAAAVAGIGLPTLDRLLLTPDLSPPFDPPFIVKPRFGGSSIGIEVVEDLQTARHLAAASPHLREGAVLEPFLPDCRDLQIAVRTHPELQLSAVEEPVRSQGGLYSYQQKYLAWGDGGGIERKLPAEMEPSLEARLQRYARRVVELVGLRSVARIDFLERNGDLWVNEVNTIPGSLGSYLWVDPPISREELLRGMVAEAEASQPRAFSTAGADGSALRNAGSIASKLG